MTAQDPSARPGFVLHTDERTPKLLTLRGTDVGMQRFDPGTRVIYAPEAQEAVAPGERIRAAVEASGLRAQVRAGSRVTLVVSDPMLPQPAMRSDVRAALLEAVLDVLAGSGVDDVQIVLATGLGRILPAESIQRLVGERVWRSFSVLGAISCHDAEADDLVEVGAAAGVPVRLNRRVATSDLVVNLRVVSEVPWACDESAGGWADVVIGASGADTVQGIRGALAQPGAGAQIAAVAAEAVQMVSVAAVLGQPARRSPLGFVGTREWEWGAADRLAYRGLRRALASAPDLTARRLFRELTCDYAVLDVIGGSPDDVARQAAESLRASQTVAVDSPADVLALGVEHPNPAGDGSVSNPVSAYWQALGRGGYAADPTLVRAGASLVVFHPLAPRFSTRLHHAASDFWSIALADGAGVEAVSSHEEKLRRDPWLLELYRTRHAYHPLQPFHLWYASRPAAERAAEVIFVGARREDAARVGGRAATRFTDALEIARANVGEGPQVTYVHGGRVQIEGRA